jgi:hypothetical protein
MKTKFRYFYDKDNRPVVTVCELESECGKTKGISICSEKDIPCKKTGRKIALDRAIYAMKFLEGESSGRVRNPLPVQRDDAIHVLENAECEDLIQKVIFG